MSIEKPKWINTENFCTTTFATFDYIRYWCNQHQWYNHSMAIDLYLIYMKQASVQNNYSTYSHNTFVAKALWWDEKTVSKYRKCLLDIWCIEAIIRRWNTGKVEWHYTKVNSYAPSIQNTVWPQGGFEPEVVQIPTNTIINKDINTIEIKANTISNKYSPPKDTIKETPDGTPSLEKTLIHKDPPYCARPPLEAAMEQFWLVYPKKVNKIASKSALALALKKDTLESIINWAKAYAQTVTTTEDKFIKYPSTFLNQECWKEYELKEDKPKFLNDTDLQNLYT